MSKLTKEERMRYEMDLRAKSSYDGGIAYSIEKAVDKAVIEEREKTLIEVASKLKSLQLSASKISEITNLQIDKIEKL